MYACAEYSYSVCSYDTGRAVDGGATGCRSTLYAALLFQLHSHELFPNQFMEL